MQAGFRVEGLLAEVLPATDVLAPGLRAVRFVGEVFPDPAFATVFALGAVFLDVGLRTTFFAAVFLEFDLFPAADRRGVDCFREDILLALATNTPSLLWMTPIAISRQNHCTVA